MLINLIFIHFINISSVFSFFVNFVRFWHLKQDPPPIFNNPPPYSTQKYNTFFFHDPQDRVHQHPNFPSHEKGGLGAPPPRGGPALVEQG